MAEAKQKKAGRGRWSLYESGKPKNRSCPKCGNGVFLAEHKDRRVCGRCRYVESKT